MRLRMTEPAAVGRINGGAPKPVTVSDEEGLGEMTAFLYAPSHRVLLLQRSRSGVRWDKLAFYFGDVLGSQNPFQFAPLLRQEIMQRLTNFRQIKRLAVRIAAPESLEGLRDSNMGVGKALDLVNAFRGAQLEFTVSADRECGSLSLSNVIKTAKDLIGFRDTYSAESVTRLEVNGKDDDAPHWEPLDLINARYFYKTKLDPSPLPETHYDRRRDAIRTAWEKSLPFLNQYYQSNP